MKQVMVKIKHLFRKKAKPVDWFKEPKTVSIYRRGCETRNEIINALFATDINDTIVVVEYIQRGAVEIMLTGGTAKEIAKAIFNTKPVGVLTLGNRDGTVYFMELPYQIRFTELNWMGDYSA
jgi:hypothetical protein